MRRREEGGERAREGAAGGGGERGDRHAPLPRRAQEAGDEERGEAGAGHELNLCVTS